MPTGVAEWLVCMIIAAVAAVISAMCIRSPHRKSPPKSPPRRQLTKADYERAADEIGRQWWAFQDEQRRQAFNDDISRSA